MSFTRTAVVVATVTVCTLSGMAHAHEDLSREQERVAVADSGLPAGGKTRAEVLAELDAAIRTGNIVDPETSRRLRDEYPQRYPHTTPAAATKQMAGRL